LNSELKLALSYSTTSLVELMTTDEMKANHNISIF